MGDPSISSNHHHHQQPLHRKRPSCASTLVAQASLCLALYATFSIWIPRASYSSSGGFSGGLVAGRSIEDLYFLSVTGGSRPLFEQTQLLQQMDAAVRMFGAKFVVDISEFGESDPLLQNATRNFPSLKIPWYATSVSNSEEEGIFHKQIAVSRELALDVIVLNTGLWQDVKHMEKVSESDSHQMAWLTRTLAVSSSNWHIIVGFHPLTNCEEESSRTQILKYHSHLHRVFLRHRVNIYLSKLGCAGHFSRQSGVTYMGNPSYAAEEFRESSTNANISREMGNSFFLHRVSPLEIESYYINSMGDTISRHTLPQWGREVM